VNDAMIALLQLHPDEAEAVPKLARLEYEHDGLNVLTPSFYSDRWQASVEPGTVPGDGREMILTADLPSELLGKLEELFAAPEDDTG
jgi:hypothetical protein